MYYLDLNLHHQPHLKWKPHVANKPRNMNQFLFQILPETEDEEVKVRFCFGTSFEAPLEKLHRITLNTSAFRETYACLQDLNYISKVWKNLPLTLETWNTRVSTFSLNTKSTEAKISSRKDLPKRVLLMTISIKHCGWLLSKTSGISEDC